MYQRQRSGHKAFLEYSQFQRLIVLLIWAIRQESEDCIRSIVSQCPDRIHEMTLLQDSLLHLALKQDKLLAFRVLIDELKRHNLDRRVLAMKDRHGNTVLHISTATKNLQIVKLLLADTTTKMVVNSKNKKGQTALDIYYSLLPLDNDALEIQDFLLEAGAQSSIESLHIN